MMFYNTHGFGYSLIAPLAGILMLAFWIVLIMLLVWIVRDVAGRRHETHTRALDILKERYAKGEISREEFEEKKKDLR